VTPVTIRCSCGRWLGEVALPAQQQVVRLGRCERCRKRKRPSYPVATVRPDGSYDLAMLARPARLGSGLLAT